MATQLHANPMNWNAGDPLPTIFFVTTCKIRHIEFDGYTGATDSVTLTDIDGNGTIFLEGDTDLDLVRTGNVGSMHGLKITAASLTGGGKVSVFFE